MVKTHKDYLIEHHGLGAEFNPPVYCACGRRTHADMCVDLTPLPMTVRKALGLETVDFLCDGCLTRLFRDRHIAEDEFFALLGAEVDALFAHNERDAEYERGVDLRHAAHKPKHQRVSMGKLSGHADPATVPISAPIPLRERVVTHERQAQWLAYKYNLTNVVVPPDVARMRRVPE
jgi:hypothetical protein